jgi:Mn-dependent DtxR family transcriptional regulator
MYAVEGDPPILPADDDEEHVDPPHAFAQFIRRTAGPGVVEPDDTPDSPLLPKQPRSLLEVGLSKAFLTDLALKIIHYSGTPALTQLIRRIGLGPGIVHQVIATLAEERLVEIMSQSDLYTGNYRYRLTERGMQRVAQALERSRYAGPCPVTAEQYSEVVRRLHEHKQDLSRSRIKSVLGELVLAPEVSDSVARALYSGKAALFYGPSGNGKTASSKGSPAD